MPAPTPPGAPSSDGSAGGGPLDPRLAARVRPTSSSLQQRLPVAPPLAPLFPAGGLQRGTVVAVQADRAGATSLALALVAPAVAAGEMSAERRNELLGELTDAVAGLVLEDNRTQSLAISLDAMRAAEATDDFRDLMFSLEKSGELDRTAESLPSLDVLVERRERAQTLTRPELCVLLAYAKLDVKRRLLESALPDDPVTDSHLLGYFPPAAAQAAGEANLHAHRLRREIIASQLTNDLVDLMGATFVNRLVRDTGREAEEVVRAWLVASRLAGHRARRRPRAFAPPARSCSYI